MAKPVVVMEASIQRPPWSRTVIASVDPCRPARSAAPGATAPGAAALGGQVDRAPRVVRPPVEPIILHRRHRHQLPPPPGPGHRPALEVPFAAARAVEPAPRR